jgi:hypothetical protein
MSLDDLPGFDATTAPSGTGAVGRTCKRHSWARVSLAPSMTDTGLDHCHRCGATRDATRSRRGRTSLRAGKDAERAIAKAYGGTRTGMYGGP